MILKSKIKNWEKRVINDNNWAVMSLRWAVYNIDYTDRVTYHMINAPKTTYGNRHESILKWLKKNLEGYIKFLEENNLQKTAYDMDLINHYKKQPKKEALKEY